MTLNQTRQLGIEFERRVQTMIPETELVSKLDTETIYSYLNQYQDKFIHDIYKALDNIPSPSKPSAYVENIIKELLTIITDRPIATRKYRYVQTCNSDDIKLHVVELEPSETEFVYNTVYSAEQIKEAFGDDSIDLDSLNDGDVIQIDVEIENVDELYTQTYLFQALSDFSYTTSYPDNFGLYVDSTTNVSSSYTRNGNGSGVVPNTLVSRSKLIEFISRPQDNMRIMRTPVATLNDDNITVYYDRYTIPVSFNITYYRTPRYMNLFTNTACELPMDAFDDLVSGAVDLYVQYVAGAEARKRQMQEQQKRNKKEDEQ